MDTHELDIIVLISLAMPGGGPTFFSGTNIVEKLVAALCRENGPTGTEVRRVVGLGDAPQSSKLGSSASTTVIIGGETT